MYVGDGLINFQWPLRNPFCSHCPLASLRAQRSFGINKVLRYELHMVPPFFSFTPLQSVMDPTYPLFPIFAFLGFILSLIPLPWHFQAWNSGTCFYMMWASLACLNQFVNSIVWRGNILNPAPIWCDICKWMGAPLDYNRVILKKYVQLFE